MELFTLDWNLILSVSIKMVVALVLALPVGWERERANRIMGLRTFPLVAVASCGYVLLGATVLGNNTEAQARIIQGLMTGMGFIGGGAILKEKNGDGSDLVRGTATAASIWATGVIGASVAYGYLTVAILVSIITLGAFLFLTPVKKEIQPQETAGGERSTEQ